MRLISDDALAIITIWQEARGLPYQGKLNVACCIRNRMKKRYFSDGSVAGTVCRDRQFSGWNADDPNRIPSLLIDASDPVVVSCAHAWAVSATLDTVKGAVLYYAKSMKAPPYWAKPDNSRVVADDEGHIFLIPVTPPKTASV